jgi:hypothetical protein
VVGSGAEYSVTGQSKGIEITSTTAMIVVGQEGSGYWIEERTLIQSTGGHRGQEVSLLIKKLMEGDPPIVKREIMRLGKKDSEIKHPKTLPDAAWSTNAVKLGTESVSVPAGTFECDHYFSEVSGKRFDIWISSAVPALHISLYPIVKLTSGDRIIELQFIYSDEKSRF